MIKKCKYKQVQFRKVKRGSPEQTGMMLDINQAHHIFLNWQFEM